MAMGEARTKEATRQIAMVCLDELVPEDDHYRLKLILADALEGIGSMRELLRVADLRLDLRLFLGYSLAERLPAH